MNIKISEILDKYLPAYGVGTRREKLRMDLHCEISGLFTPVINDIKDRIKKLKIMEKESGDNTETYFYLNQIEFLQSLLKKLS